MSKKVLDQFILTTADLRKITGSFHKEMSLGLRGRKSSLKMIPAYIDIPTGDERGEYLACDLGGTNFRVCGLRLKGSGRLGDMVVKKYALTREQMTGGADALFDFIAKAIIDFTKLPRIRRSQPKEVGFTFSFPVSQTAINSGILIRWTKGFKAKGAEGKDVVGLLAKALKRRGSAGLNVSALVNDTVGTLVARAYSDKKCDVGVILGTGTNACYREDVLKIKKAKALFGAHECMIVNIEWGNFNKLDVTPYDITLDDNSHNPREQRLEKMVSGMYLGEIVRLVLKDLINGNMIFTKGAAAGISAEYSFKTEYVSRIEADNAKDMGEARAIFLKYFGIGPTIDERRVIKRICQAVTTRAARISAAAIGAVVTAIDPKIARPHTVAVDGSVYEKHPGFSGNIRKTLRELFGAKASRMRCVLSKDGSGKGAAIIAAVAASKGR